jgi:hypothetical protein
MAAHHRQRHPDERLTLGIYQWSLQLGADLPVARTLAINTLIAAEMLFLINCRSLMRASFSHQAWFGKPPCVVRHRQPAPAAVAADLCAADEHPVRDRPRRLGSMALGLLAHCSITC